MAFAESKVGKRTMYPGDLGILNEFFMHRWKRVPNVYSYCDYYLQKEEHVPSGVKMIQYNGPKPWNIGRSRLRKSHGPWFAIFNRLLSRNDTIIPKVYRRTLGKIAREFATPIHSSKNQSQMI